MGDGHYVFRCLVHGQAGVGGHEHRIFALKPAQVHPARPDGTMSHSSSGHRSIPVIDAGIPYRGLSPK